MLNAHFTTSEGNFTVRLFDEDVPNTVANFVGLAEAVDDVDRNRNRGDAGIARLAENLAGVGIDRDGAVAVLLHVLRGEEARPIPVRRQSDDGDHAGLREDAAQPRDVVDARHPPLEANAASSDSGCTDSSRECAGPTRHGC